MTVAALWHTVGRLVADGGAVTPVLLAVAVVLWGSLGLRALTLRRGTRADVEVLQRAPRVSRATLLGRALAAWRESAGTGEVGQRLLEEVGQRLMLEADRGRRGILTLTAVAPLLGLLGTVVGMIETFDGLGSMTLFAQSGGVAGGVGQALLSTQVGLVVAVPGLLLGRVLDRKQRALQGDFERLIALGTKASTSLGGA